MEKYLEEFIIKRIELTKVECTYVVQAKNEAEALELFEEGERQLIDTDPVEVVEVGTPEIEK